MAATLTGSTPAAWFGIRPGTDPPYAVALALNLVGYPLVSILPLSLGIESRPVSMLFRAVLLALSLWLIARRVHQQRPVLRGWTAGLFWFVWSLLLARLVWDSSLTLLPLDLDWTEQFVFGIGVSLIPAAVFLEIPGRGTLLLALTLIERLGVIALLGVLWLAGSGLFSGALLSRLGTETLNPSSVGNLSLTVFIALAARYALDRERRCVPCSLLRILLMLVAALVLVASASKAPLITLLLVLLLPLFPVGKDLGGAGARLIRAGLISAMAAIGFYAAVAFEENTSLRTLSRFTDILEDQSTEERTMLLRGALEQFARSPWFGDAAVELQFRAYPHNVYVEALMATGVFGFLALFGLSMAAMLAAARTYLAGRETRWIALLFLQYALAGILSGSLLQTPVFWVMLLVVISAAAGLDQHGVERRVAVPA